MRPFLILLTFCLLGAGIPVSAQSDGWQYPFPYNPDGNSDGFITLNDMLDLLSVYGQEFPETFFGDSTGAILDLGTMLQFDCLLQARLAGSQWRMMTRVDFLRWFNHLASIGQTEFEQGLLPNNRLTGLLLNDDNTFSPWSLLYGETSQFQSYTFASDYNDNAPPNLAVDNFSHSYIGSASNGNSNTIGGHRCFLVTEVLPEYQFTHCHNGSGGDFNQCVTEKLNDGWIPMPGGTKGSASWYYQGFWRISPD